MTSYRAALALGLALISMSGNAQTINDHALWNIRSDAGETRWVQIREFARQGKDQIYHLDVYRRENGDLEEFYERLVDHMAIEKEALLNSIGQAIEIGVPDRQAYERALTEWARQAPTERFVCRSPIQRCMQNADALIANDY